MSAPCYFLPRVTRALLCPGGKLARSVLAGRGLGDVWHDVELEDLVVNEIAIAGGPGGSHGLLLSALPVASREAPRRVTYNAADTHVHWTSHLGGEVWIGVDDLSPVTPADLVRRRTLRGHWIELADGHTWEVPVLRHVPEHTTELPRDFEFDEGNQLVMTIKERYRRLWEESAETARFYFEAGKGDEVLSFGVAVLRTLDALALNYRLGPLEQNALKLLDSTNVRAALGATVDEPKVTELLAVLQKKRAEAAAAQSSPSSGPGPTAG